MSVLSLEYSVSPYTKFPVQLNEAIEGYHKLAATCNRTILLGDSADGTLAIALVIKFRELGTPERFSVVWSLRGFHCLLIQQGHLLTLELSERMDHRELCHSSAERYTGSEILTPD